MLLKGDDQRNTSPQTLESCPFLHVLSPFDLSKKLSLLPVPCAFSDLLSLALSFAPCTLGPQRSHLIAEGSVRHAFVHCLIQFQMVKRPLLKWSSEFDERSDTCAKAWERLR